MIVLITYLEKGSKTVRPGVYVSHGVDYNTMRNIVLSNDPIEYYVRECGAKHDPNIGWYLPDEK